LTGSIQKAGHIPAIVGADMKASNFPFLDKEIFTFECNLPEEKEYPLF
jgi:hypothetical protein